MMKMKMMMNSPLLWLQLCLVVCYGFRRPSLLSLYSRSSYSSSRGLFSQQVQTRSGSSATASNVLSSCTLGSHSVEGCDTSAEVDITSVSIVYRIKRLLAPVLVSCGLVVSGISSSVCFAAVGEGDLPPGAMAFTKVLKYQTEWKSLASTIKLRANELSEQEVLGIKAFLKALANEYGDLELLSGGIQDDTRKKAAISDAKEFRKLIRQCDDAASAGDFNKINELYPVTAALLNSVLSSMQDVPDEL